MSLSSLLKTCIGKKKYLDERDASKALQRSTSARKTPLRIYICQFCGMYHLTKLNATVPNIPLPPEPKDPKLCAQPDCRHDHRKDKPFCRVHTPPVDPVLPEQKCKKADCPNARKKNGEWCKRHNPLNRTVILPKPERRAKLIAAGIIKS